jgi:hypothetical protein
VNFLGLEMPLCRRVCGRSYAEGAIDAISTADPSRDPDGAEDSALSAKDPTGKFVAGGSGAVAIEDPRREADGGDSPTRAGPHRESIPRGDTTGAN